MPDNQGVKERLLAYISYKGISKSAFGTSLGASTSFVDAIRSSISPEKLKSIAVKYPDLNILWLLLGEDGGKMLSTEEPSAGNTVTGSNNIVDSEIHVQSLTDEICILKARIEDLQSDKDYLLKANTELKRQNAEYWDQLKKMMDK